MPREIALSALVALDYPVRRATARATRTPGIVPWTSPSVAAGIPRHGDARRCDRARSSHEASPGRAWGSRRPAGPGPESRTGPGPENSTADRGIVRPWPGRPARARTRTQRPWRPSQRQPASCPLPVVRPGRCDGITGFTGPSAAGGPAQAPVIVRLGSLTPADAGFFLALAAAPACRRGQAAARHLRYGQMPSVPGRYGPATVVPSSVYWPVIAVTVCPDGSWPAKEPYQGAW